jgi:thioredoxin-related protein
MVAIEVSNDHEGTEEFYAENGFDVPTAFDTSGVARQYGIMGTPTAYLLDENGHIVWRKYGYVRGEEGELEERIADLLSASS